MKSIIWLIILVAGGAWYYTYLMWDHDKKKVDKLLNKAKNYVEMLTTSVSKAEEVRDTYNKKNSELEDRLEKLKTE